MPFPASPLSTVSDSGRKIRAVAFDAVGTLIYAQPSVATAYCQLLDALSGRRVDPNEVRQVLSRRLSERSATDDLTTNEPSERKFWFDVIAELVPEQHLQQSCFESLYEHFASPLHWRCYDDVADCLEALRNQNLQVVLASNFDERLHRVCKGLAELQMISDCIISSEVGWRKPASQFFEAVCRRINCRPDEVLFVGDDLLNDIHGAHSAGMLAAWIDRRGEPRGTIDDVTPPADADRVLRLSSLKDLHVHVAD